MEWVKLLKIAFKITAGVFFSPLFWIVIILIYFQYKRVGKNERDFYGDSSTSVKKRLFTSLGAGLVGGVLGTLIVTFLGITLRLQDLQYIMPLAILLMLINVRYLCFSYAGGIICIMSVLFGIPDVNVPSILSLIAILHLIESLLIRIDGYKDPIPIFVEREGYGVVGGFTLNRFWPIPFVIMLIANKTTGIPFVDLPDWWPVISSDTFNIKNVSIQLTVVMAALGYGDIAISSTPKEKCKSTALHLAMYSLILLGLSILATKYKGFLLIAALFAPLAHEGLILYSQRGEKMKTPYYSSKGLGLMVLDVKKDSIGETMGLRSGYKILKANNQLIRSKEDLKYILEGKPYHLYLEVINSEGNIDLLEYSDFLNRIDGIGAIVVSSNTRYVVDTNKNMNIVSKLLKKIKQTN